MGDVTNLRLHRKRAERRERDRTAAANRAAFGQSKADRKAGEAEQASNDRLLDCHRLSGKREDGETS